MIQPHDGSGAAPITTRSKRFVDSDALIIGAHFGDPVAGRIRRRMRPSG